MKFKAREYLWENILISDDIAFIRLKGSLVDD
jgi:hypothetical protein